MKTIIIRPIITEKTLTMASTGRYTFMVDLKATKLSIADAVALRFKVTVVDVRTATMHGKTRRVGKSMKHIRKPNWKKAFVQVTKGQKIDAFEVVPQEGATQ